MKKSFIFYFLLFLVSTSNSFGSVTILMRNYNAAPATQITVPVKVKDFINIISVQGTIQFDQTITSFASVQDFGLPGMNASSFGTSQTGIGKLTFSWFDASLVGVNLPDSATIFSVKYNVIGSIGQISTLSFINNPTLMEVVNNTFATETLILQNGSVNVQNTSVPANVTLKIDTISGTHGSQVVISVRGIDFTNINSFQGTLQFDPAIVSYGGIGFYGLPGLSSSNFGTSQISAGKLTFSWFDNTLTGQDMPDNSPLFSILFNLIGNAGEQSILSFGATPTPLEVTDSLFNTLTVNTVNGAINITGTTSIQTLRLKIDTVSGPNSSQVIVPVRAWQFHKMISMQGTISFNTSIATFSSVEQFGLTGMDASNFGTTQINSGKLMFSWSDPTLTGQNLSDSSIVFAIRFDIVGFPVSVTPLDFINAPTPVEFIDTTYNVINSILESGQIRVSGVMTLTTNDPAIFTYCTSDSVHISYTAFGGFNASNSFILQLSDASGSFISPTVVSTLNSTTSGIFNSIIPLSVTNGNNYRFRVISTNPGLTGTENGTNISILESPAIPNIPLGNNQLCSNPINSIYTTNPAAGATSYLWTIEPPTSGTIAPSDTSVQVDWSDSYTGMVQIYVSSGNGTCQSINSDTLLVQIYPTPEIPEKPFGDSLLCASSINSIYTINQVNNASSYEWQLNPGTAGTITGTDTSAVVNWNPLFSGIATISVRGLSSYCSGSFSTDRNVTILLSPASPVLLSGDTLLCINPSNSTYIFSTVVNATSYLWSMETIGSGTITPTDTIAIVDWDDFFIGIAQINFIATNGTCSTMDSIMVEIHSTPSATNPINGLTNACDSTTITYSVINDPNNTSYTWTLPPGWYGTSTTNSIDVTTGNTGGFIFVTANNNCGSGTPDSILVSITNAPIQPGTITGSTNVCQGNNIVYSVDTVPGATSYNWNMPGGWTGGSPINSINATASDTSGYISVIAVNNCGISPVQSIYVTVNPLPIAPSIIYGSNTICEGVPQTYYIDSIAGSINYTWTVPSGWSSSSTNDTILLTPDANAGIISVYATNICGDGPAQQLWITVQIPPSQPILSWADSVICDSSFVNYSVIYDLNVDSFTWTLPFNWIGSSTNANMSAFAATNSGQVTVVKNNSCGIGPALVINVTINPLPIVTVSSFGVICDTLTSFTLTGGLPSGGYYSGTGVYNDSIFSPSVSGVGTFPITYVYTDTNSCSSQAIGDIQVDLCLKISSSISPSDEYEVFPNPFSSEITVISKPENNVELLNVLGEILYTEKTINGINHIDTKNLSSGIYFVKISNEQGINLKMILKR